MAYVPGITGDGDTPPGINVEGKVVAGDTDQVILYPTGRVAINQTLVNAVAFSIEAAAGSTSGYLAYFDDSNGTDFLAIFNDGTITMGNSAGITQFQVDADGVQVHGKFKVGSAVTHTLDAYSGKSVPIYDEAGTLLGYMPLYG